MKVLVLQSLPPEAPGDGRHAWEFDLSEAAASIVEILPETSVASVRGSPAEVFEVLSKHQPDVVFNLCEAPLGRTDREAHVAALLEWLGIRFTGCGSETLALCRRKDFATAVLAANGVAVPRSDCFPCIVKPASEHGSVGLNHGSVCEDPGAVEVARAKWDGPVLVQEFLPGREFVISLWGNSGPDFFSIGEMLFKGGLRINTYAAKWEVESADYANSPISYTTPTEAGLRDALLDAARGAWQAVGARGYLRVDVRLDSEGTPRVMDVNANPSVSPEVGMHRAVTEAGWTWQRFVQLQIEWAR